MKALITGGGGFLGFALAQRLTQMGWDVTCYQRGQYDKLTDISCKSVQGSLSDLPKLIEACKNIDVVFHVAAIAGVWGPYKHYYETNVVGTQNVIAACKRQGVSKCVYTSSPSVVFDGRDEININENVHYPHQHLCHYSATKALAEQYALHSIDAHFSCCALRPHLIWGPGDQHLLPRIIERRKAGKLRFVGNGENLIDSTYIDNAVDAHVAAAERLSPTASCNGKAYFVSNGQAMCSKKLINALLSCASLEPVEEHVSAVLAYGVGAVLEASYWLLRKKTEPIMTRFVARQLATHHYFDLSALKNDIGYSPAVSNEEGFQRLKDWFNHA